MVLVHNKNNNDKYNVVSNSESYDEVEEAFLRSKLKMILKDPQDLIKFKINKSNEIFLSLI